MQYATVLIVATFLAVYVGMALGRWPGLKIDRTGIAALGAIVLYSTGIVGNEMVLRAIDFPTLIVLFGLMVLSAQFGASGFYDWCSARIDSAQASPAATLALTIVVAGTLSALLANDVVVFAMTPMLIQGSPAGASIRGPTSLRWPAPPMRDQPQPSLATLRTFSSGKSDVSISGGLQQHVGRQHCWLSRRFLA
jgi:hypothetical protein